MTLDAGLEVKAGAVSFRTDSGLDVLPVVGECFVKQPLVETTPDLVDYYRQLYASLQGTVPGVQDVRLYQTVSLVDLGPTGARLQTTADSSLWVALLLPEGPPPTAAALDAARQTMAGRTLTIGVVPVITLGGRGRRRRLPPRARRGAAGLPDAARLRRPAAAARLERTGRGLSVAGRPALGQRARRARHRADRAAGVGRRDRHLGATWSPSRRARRTSRPTSRTPSSRTGWSAGCRVRAATGSQADLLHVGINTVTVTQRERIVLEPLPEGTGAPDQSVQLAKGPVLPGTATDRGDHGRRRRRPGTRSTTCSRPAPRSRCATRGCRPVRRTPPPRDGQVFALDASRARCGSATAPAGRVRRVAPGCRPATTSTVGAGGNVGPGALSSAPASSGTFSVTNPLPTWGGADSESPAEAEKQRRPLPPAPRPAWSRPRTSRRSCGARRASSWAGSRSCPPSTRRPRRPRQAPGAVTVLVIPRVDALHPQAPEPDRLFLTTVCRYLDPRRLVTTEVFLRGPSYVDLWVSRSVSRSRWAATSRSSTRRFATPYAASSRRWTRTVTTGSSASRWRWGGPRRPRPGTAGRSARPCSGSRSPRWPTGSPGVRLVREVLVASGHRRGRRAADDLRAAAAARARHRRRCRGRPRRPPWWPARVALRPAPRARRTGDLLMDR